MLDSKPEASSAHMVVNMASLPSTVTVVSAGACAREATAGACILRGVCVCDCDGASGVPCEAACQAMVAPSPKSAVSPSFLIPAAAALTRASRLLYFSPLASLSMEGNTGERSRFSHNAAASLQSNVALTIRQGIAFIRVYSNRAWARKSSEPVGSSEQGVFDRVPFTDFLRSSGCNACPHSTHLLRLEIRASF